MIDLRSDTVTRPSRAMLERMMAAPTGDDVYGDDPTVNQLQNLVAKLSGKEAALFLPTGTQANLVGFMTATVIASRYWRLPLISLPAKLAVVIFRKRIPKSYSANAVTIANSFPMRIKFLKF